MNKNEIIFGLNTPYAPISKWLAKDTDFADSFAYVKESDKYDWSRMIPKVTYDDWIVCHYLVDNKLYRIDMEDCIIEEVVAVEVLQYDEKYRALDHDGNIVDEDKLFTYCDNLCCGESDDMSCYIYFDIVK